MSKEIEIQISRIYTYYNLLFKYLENCLFGTK